MRPFRSRTLILIFAAAAAVLMPGYAPAERPEIQPPLTPLASDGIHDPGNPALPSLQNPDESLANLPKDRRGEVNWVESLKGNLIDPRKSLHGEAAEGEPLVELDMDIIMKNTQQMPHVRFPHIAHTRWLACSNCHPDIFVAKAGGNPISMEKILKGQFCGRCHDKVSFSLYVCERCHSVPHAGSGPAWWK